MGLQFTRGTTATLFANFLLTTGEEPTTVTDPKITIKHIDGAGVLQTDVNEASMTLAAESLYYYQWAIPSDADMVVYTAEYQATLDGDYVESTQDVQVFGGGFPGSLISCDYTTKEKIAAMIDGVDAADIEDDWVDWASAYINMYTGIKFCSQTYSEYFDIEGDHVDTLFLKHFPVTSITSVHNDETLVDSDDYLLYEDEGIVKLKDYYDLTILTQAYFTRGRKKVKVIYDYGYTAVPNDIIYAATFLAARITMQALGLTASEIVEKQIGDTRIQYSNPREDRSSLQLTIIDIQKNILDKYKRKDTLAV